MKDSDERKPPQGDAGGAWLIVNVIMVVFILFFLAAAAVYAVMNGWIGFPPWG